MMNISNKTLLIGAAVLLAGGIVSWHMTRGVNPGVTPQKIESNRPRESEPRRLSDARSEFESPEERRVRLARYNQFVETGEWPDTARDTLEYFRFLLDRDPKLALRLYDNALEDEKKRTAARIIAGEWFARDPVACLQWVADDKWLCQRYLLARSAIADAINRVDFNRNELGDVLDAVSRLANAMPDQTARRDVESDRKSILSGFGEDTEVAEIIRQAKRLGLEKEADFIIGGRARTAPEEVVEYFKTKGEVMPDQVAIGLVRGRLEENTDDALGYLEGHQWQDERQLAMLSATVMERYLEADSMNASDSLRGMTPGKTRDYCIMAMAKWLSQRGSAVDVVPWISAIQDSKIRQLVEDMAK